MAGEGEMSDVTEQNLGRESMVTVSINRQADQSYPPGLARHNMSVGGCATGKAPES